MRKTVLELAMAMTLAPLCAFAVDGVILINQSTVTAAGGFPYVISQPGSYKLSGNLAVPAGLNGINISASDVTLDLNGFTISGAHTPFGLSNTALIAAVGFVNGITVRNGTLFGDARFSEISFFTANGVLLEHLLIRDVTGGNQSFFGANVVVRGVSNPGGTIGMTCPALVVDSLATIFGRNQTNSTACVFGFISGQVI